MEFLYFHRAATLSQLSRVTGLDGHDLRRKLERFPAITCTTNVMTLYVNGEWLKLSRVNVYTLSREVTLAYEDDYKTVHCYRNHPKADPRPDSKSLNRFVLVTELALRFPIQEELDIRLIPNVILDEFLFEGTDQKDSVQLPITGGLAWMPEGVQDPYFFGIGLFTNSIGGFTSYLKRAFPAQYDDLYKGLVFVTAGLLKEAITICQRHAPHVILQNYEWSIQKTQIIRYGLCRQWDVILKAYIEQYEWRNCTVSYDSSGHGTLGFRWKVKSEDKIIEYFDTTVGRTIGEIQKMATQRTVKGVVFVTTQEEKEAWEVVSKTAFANVKYQIIDWSIH